MRQDVINLTRKCLHYQTAKITRHNKAPVALLPPSTVKFHDTHVDKVGPLPDVEGYKYILTCNKRFSRWAVAEPLKDARAITVADAFIKCLVQNYGVPRTITTDRGSNFESSLFNDVLKRFDIEHIRTTAYRPQHSGLVERWHRRLKDALTAAADEYAWVKHLPLIMLNLRVAVRDDGRPSPSELVYGTPLTLPGDLVGDLICPHFFFSTNCTCRHLTDNHNPF